MKMLARFDPWREFDRLVDGFTGRETAARMPVVGYRRDGSFVVEFDLPGVDPDGIELTIEKNVLTVRAERPTALPEGNELVFSERPVGTFERRVYLSNVLDTEHLVAGYEHGVLRVTVPVLEQAKPRKVEITVGTEAPKAVEAQATEPVPVAA